MSAFYECSEDILMRNQSVMIVDFLLNEHIYKHFVHQCGLQPTKLITKIFFKQ